MKNSETIELEKCVVCGREYEKASMSERFTGRVKYICPECEKRGNRQVKASHAEWRKTSKGKAVIALCEKNK